MRFVADLQRKVWHHYEHPEERGGNKSGVLRERLNPKERRDL